MFLMISTYLRPLEEVDRSRDDHQRFLDGLEAAGVLVTAGRQDPPTGGVVVLDVATEAEAREVISADPYVAHGLARYEAVGWRPVRGALAGWSAPGRERDGHATVRR